MGGILSRGAFNSQGEASAFVASLGQGSSKMYYFLLNKFALNILINFYIANGSSADVNAVLPISAGQWTESQSEAANWSTQDDNFNSDSADPASVKALKIVGAVAKSKSKGLITLTVLQCLVFTYDTLLLENSFASRACASFLIFIINELQRGEITDAEASIRYNQLIARFPTLFL